MTRFTFGSILAIALLTACGGGSEATPDTDAATETSSPVDDECILGHERCGCMAGACLEGLVCLSDLCVAPAEAETSTSDASTGIDTVSDESTSDPIDPTTDPGTTTDATEDTSTDDGAETSTDDGATESSTGDPEPACLHGDNYCDDGTFQTCTDDGQWEVSSCVEHCALLGYDSPGCASHDACNCEGFIDDFCYEALVTLCICYPAQFECDEEQAEEFYDLCIAGNETLLCYGQFPYESQQATCGPANAACA
jgi:hypothetical protein